MSNLSPTYGALFVGVLLSAVLFGVTMLQMFVYFQQYPTDRPWRKLAVGWLWLLDAIHLALSAHFVYFYLVTNFDKPDALLHIVWSFKLRIVVDSLVVCSVHTLYTSRLWTLLAIDERMEPFGKEARRWSRQKLTAQASVLRWIMRKLVPWLVSGMVGLGYGIAIVMCVETFKLESFGELAHTPWATYVPLGASTVIDGIIAGSLCYFLARCRPRSEPMNGHFKALMVYTLNTGTITGLFSLLAISMMVAYPTTFIPIAIEFVVIKLYINSYMAMLNARGVIHPSQVYHTGRTSFLPGNSRILRYPLEQKGLPFASFSASVASLHLAQRPPNPSPTPGAHHAPTSDARASAEWTRPSPVPTLRAPRLSHPDVSPQYGGIETVVGVAFPAAALGQQQRFNSFTSASSSATVAVPPSPNPLAAVYATPVDPLSTTHPLPPTLHIEMAEITETTVDPPEYPSPPDRALSPLRFASYASSTPSPSGSLSSRSSPTYPRHSRPRIPSAYSMDTRDGEERRTSLPSDPGESEWWPGRAAERSVASQSRQRVHPRSGHVPGQAYACVRLLKTEQQARMEERKDRAGGRRVRGRTGDRKPGSGRGRVVRVPQRIMERRTVCNIVSLGCAGEVAARRRALVWRQTRPPSSSGRGSADAICATTGIIVSCILAAIRGMSASPKRGPSPPSELAAIRSGREPR